MTCRSAECTATGNLVASMPPGPERDEILGLVRIGLTFSAQRVGRRPGPLARQVQAIVQRRGGVCSFADLLEEIWTDGARGVGCVTTLNRIWETVDYNDQRRTYRVTFGTLRNLLSSAKKKLLAETSREPLNRELPP